MSELIDALKSLLASDIECPAAVREVAAAIKSEGADAEITESDDGPDDMGSEGALWVVSNHALVIDGVTVAEWARCAMGTYGEQGRQCSEDEWCVSEDTNGGDRLPAMVEVALDAFGLEDSYPGVPEPTKADEEYETDDAGEYAVYWETVGDDAHPVARYATLKAAQAVCDQRNREFAARNPSGGGTTYLCGYGVRELVAGKWSRTEEE